jgi:hypothetical protein
MTIDTIGSAHSHSIPRQVAQGLRGGPTYATDMTVDHCQRGSELEGSGHEMDDVTEDTAMHEPTSARTSSLSTQAQLQDCIFRDSVDAAACTGCSQNLQSGDSGRFCRGGRHLYHEACYLTETKSDCRCSYVFTPGDRKSSTYVRAHRLEPVTGTKRQRRQARAIKGIEQKITQYEAQFGETMGFFYFRDHTFHVYAPSLSVVEELLTSNARRITASNLNAIQSEQADVPDSREGKLTVNDHLRPLCGPIKKHTFRLPEMQSTHMPVWWPLEAEAWNKRNAPTSFKTGGQIRTWITTMLLRLNDAGYANDVHRAIRVGCRLSGKM